MKSMLHEASSITKAIEKAWIESGKPAEFTIKILEKGEKNFFGMSKRPAIVSITYNAGFGPDRSRNKSFAQPKPFNKAQEPKYSHSKVEIKDKNTHQRGVVKEVLVEKEKPSDREIISWNNEMVDYCSANLKDILGALKFDNSFNAKINNKNLVITFDKNIVIAVSDDLKSFFASVAHILMQLLKRKYKKRFRGIQIIINHISSNDTPNPSKSN